MCNRYGFQHPLHKLLRMFEEAGMRLEAPATNLEPREEIKPTDQAPIVIGDGDGARLEEMRWGFRPFRPKAAPVINFRSEGRVFAKGRALAPASHFFEFTGPANPKQKRKDQWKFELTSGEPMMLAALARGPDGEWPTSFSLLTRDAGADIGPFHDREIIVVPREFWRPWLTGESFKGEDLPSLAGGSLNVNQTYP